MSTRPVALPKIWEQASLRKGLTSLPKMDGFRYTPNSSSIFFTLLSCSPRIYTTLNLFCPWKEESAYNAIVQKASLGKRSPGCCDLCSNMSKCCTFAVSSKCFVKVKGTTKAVPKAEWTPGNVDHPHQPQLPCNAWQPCSGEPEWRNYCMKLCCKHSGNDPTSTRI